KASELDPKDAPAHYNLGNVLRARGDLVGAIAAYQKAIECDPKFTSAHNNLGGTLKARGDLEGAIAAYRQATACDPKHAKAHYGLGLALEDKNDLTGAIASYRAAIKADPKYPEAHCSLGCALLREGRFTDALDPLKQGHALGSKRPGWRHPSDAWVRQSELLLALDRKLAAVLRGAEVANTIERLQLAWLCQQPFKRLYHASARLYGDAFAADPKLADDLQAQLRYKAACAAALAAAGKGEGTGK